MLRTKVTLVAVTAIVAAILVTIVTAYRAVSPLVADQIDRGLTDRADTVLAVLDAGATPPVRPDVTEQLLLPDGTVRPLTPGRDPLPVTDADRAVARAGQGANETEVVADGETHGVLTKGRPGGGAVMVSQNWAEVERIDHQFLWRTTWITLVAVAVAALFSWLVIGRILRPIHRLAAATKHITSTGDLSAATLPDPGGGEVGDLTRSFDSMLSALRFSRAQQHRLVQDASHELRTPLTSVRGSAELLQRARGRLTPEDEATVLTTLVQEARALDALIGELVDLATDQHTAEAAVALELPALAEDCAQRFRRRTGRTITVTADDPVTVTARPQGLARCVDNLLNNATKYSPEDTPIVVHIHRTRLSVRDNGSGIDPADIDSVFDRFYRAGRTRSTPGSGLGLAIVHDIVTAHDGTVFARNRPEGGAEVGFELSQRN
ncbi:sensor histidine kinase [Nocardia jejuensis]|uniref:sensor histidine kinase n=1 Tax=Nocardia jejuensis TaxID=328049 RepID=UPI000A540C92|nr:HAMP domain-containing sensor histidine kinase [Nocardia jejuensis]